MKAFGIDPSKVHNIQPIGQGFNLLECAVVKAYAPTIIELSHANIIPFVEENFDIYAPPPHKMHQTREDCERSVIHCQANILLHAYHTNNPAHECFAYLDMKEFMQHQIDACFKAIIQKKTFKYPNALTCEWLQEDTQRANDSQMELDDGFKVAMSRSQLCKIANQ